MHLIEKLYFKKFQFILAMQRVAELQDIIEQQKSAAFQTNFRKL